MKPLTIRKLMAIVLQASLLLAFFIVVLPSLPGFLGFQSRCTNQRRLQCLSNLRQLGQGVEAYTNQHGFFPPGTIPNANLPIERRLGWGFLILPYIDLAGYFQERGTTQEAAMPLAWDDPVSADLANQPPGITRCPESLDRKGYIAIAGLGADATSLPKSNRRAGIFGDDRKVCPADIKDGASTTMMLAESDSTGTPWFAGGRATVRGLDPFRKPYIGPNRQFGGHHPGGTNVLFADGSCKFISESIDPKILEALSTMAGGEAVKADDL